MHRMAYIFLSYIHLAFASHTKCETSDMKTFLFLFDDINCTSSKPGLNTTAVCSLWKHYMNEIGLHYVTCTQLRITLTQEEVLWNCNPTVIDIANIKEHIYIKYRIRTFDGNRWLDASVLVPSILIRSSIELFAIYAICFIGFIFYFGIVYSCIIITCYAHI